MSEALLKALIALKDAVREQNEIKKAQAAEDLKKNLGGIQGSGRRSEIDLSNADPGSGGIEAIHKSFERDVNIVEFQKRADDVYILSKVLGVDPRTTKLYGTLFEPISNLRKAMDTATSGSGAEWVPTGFSSDLIRRVELALKVPALHPRVNMPQDPFKVPALIGFSTARLGVENTAPTASGVTTANVTLDAKKLITYVPLSYELEEDSIIAVLPLIKEDIVKALARAQENAMLNGDTSGTHMDSDVTNAEDVRKAWKGYRKLTLPACKTDMANAPLSVAALFGIRKLMARYGVEVNELAYVLGIAGFMDIIDDQNVYTVDKYGPGATILTGELGRVGGIPIIVSEYVREDLNASGVYDGTTTNRTVAHLVRRDGFLMGDRRDVLVEADRNIKTQSIDLVSSQRVACSPRYDTSTEKIMAMVYNIAV